MVGQHRLPHEDMDLLGQPAGPVLVFQVLPPDPVNDLPGGGGAERGDQPQGVLPARPFDPGRAGPQQRVGEQRDRCGEHGLPGDQSAERVPQQVDRPLLEGGDDLGNRPAQRRTRVGVQRVAAGRLVLARQVDRIHSAPRLGQRSQQRNEVFFASGEPGHQHCGVPVRGPADRAGGEGRDRTGRGGDGGAVGTGRKGQDPRSAHERSP